MASPVRHSRSSRTSAVDEVFQVALSACDEGDVLTITWAGDGSNTGMEDVCGQFVGWNRHYIETNGTMSYGQLFKIASAAEVALAMAGTLLSMSSPLEKWCIEVGSISGAHIDADDNITWAEGSSSSPDPPANGGYTGAPHDALWHCYAASDGSSTFSGVPTGFSSVARLNNGAADGVALDFAEQSAVQGVGGLNPSTFTKSASSSWAAVTREFIAPLVVPSASIRSERAEVLTGSTLDFDVEVVAGFFCAALQNASFAQTVSVVLDPGGANQRTLTVSTDGVSQAAVGGGPGTVAFYQLDPDDMPQPGSYTLRVSLTTSLTCGLFSFNIDDGNQVVDVLNASHASSATGTVSTQAGDLVLVAAGQVANAPGGAPKQGRPWVTRSIDAANLWPRLSAWYATDYVTVFARRIRSAATSTITVDATTVNMTAMVIRYRPREDNAPWWGTEF